ncbi:hypothetical protein BLNAU_8675 [Blattamonas nauphoetae]|uniref:SPRY domain-containing protein n=1 Tax=Blattamonas nauphoetae TaxID=2049346 RepID=A0ABQ9XXY0_9EUKA|nr:hypothetical protein BLNAU_8675 [Blattamonas nauphoetae]
MIVEPPQNDSKSDDKDLMNPPTIESVLEWLNDSSVHPRDKVNSFQWLLVPSLLTTHIQPQQNDDESHKTPNKQLISQILLTIMNNLDQCFDCHTPIANKRLLHSSLSQLSQSPSLSPSVRRDVEKCLASLKTVDEGQFVLLRKEYHESMEEALVSFTQIQQQHSQLRKEMEHIQQENERLQREIVTTTQKLDENERRIAEQQKQLAQHDQLIARHDKLESEQIILRSKEQSFLSTLNALQQQHDQLHAQFGESERRITKLEQEKTDLFEEKKTLLSMNQSLNQEKEQKRQENEQLKQVNQHLRMELAKKTQKQEEKKVNDTPTQQTVQPKMTAVSKKEKMFVSSDIIVAFNPTHFRVCGPTITRLGSHDWACCFTKPISKDIHRLSIKTEASIVNGGAYNSPKAGMMFNKTGKLYIAKNTRFQNTALRRGQELSVEADMKKKTFHFFVDGVQQPHHFINIPVHPLFINIPLLHSVSQQNEENNVRNGEMERVRSFFVTIDDQHDPPTIGRHWTRPVAVGVTPVLSSP